MARVDVSGSETGSVNELDSVTIGGAGGTRTFGSSTTTPRAGLRSWRAVQTTPTSAGNIYGTITRAMSTGCVRFSFRFVTLPPSQDSIVSLRDNLGNGFCFGLNVSVNRMQVEDGAVAGNSSGSVEFTEPVVAGVWYDAYIRWNVSGATKQFWASFSNQELFLEQTSWSGTSVQNLNFGISTPPRSGLTSMEVLFDDIIIDNSNAAIDHGRFLVALRPNSDNLKDLLIPAAGTHFDDVSDNADGTFVQTTLAAAQFDLYGLTDCGIDTAIPALSRTIPAVYASIRAGGATDSVAATDQRIGLQLAGVNSALAQPTVSLTPTTKRAILVATTNPSGGNWSPADLNGLQIFVGKNASTLADIYTYIEVWVTAEVAIHINIAETAALADSEVVRGRPALTETITLAEVLNPRISVVLADTIALAESMDTRVRLDFSDGAALVDQLTSLKASLALDDGATLNEALLIKVSATLTDGATLADALSSLKASIALTDGATIVETYDHMIFVSYLLATGGTTVRKVIFGIFD